MDLVLQHDEASCLPTSIAMVLGIMPVEIFAFYDRSEGNWHPQQMIDYVWLKHGKAIITIDGQPPAEHTYYPERLAYWLDYPSVLLLQLPSGKHHAVAWDGNKTYDPMGRIGGIDLKDVQIDAILVIPT